MVEVDIAGDGPLGVDEGVVVEVLPFVTIEVEALARGCLGENDRLAAATAAAFTTLAALLEIGLGIILCRGLNALGRRLLVGLRRRLLLAEEHRDVRGAVNGMSAGRKFDADVEHVVFLDRHRGPEVNGVEATEITGAGLFGLFAVHFLAVELVVDRDGVVNLVGRRVEADGPDLLAARGFERIHGLVNWGQRIAPAVSIMVVDVLIRQQLDVAESDGTHLRVTARVLVVIADPVETLFGHFIAMAVLDEPSTGFGGTTLAFLSLVILLSSQPMMAIE